MSRLCLTFIAAVILFAMAVASVPAAETGDGSLDTLSAYLHRNRLPLVEARMISDRYGERSVLLYGFVATPYGKRDAEDQARDFLDDPDITIVNRIKIRPELLTLGTRSNSDQGAQTPDALSPDAPDELEDNSAQTAAQTEALPTDLGDREAYSNQQRDEDLLMGNGISVGGIPLALLILGSAPIIPQFGPPAYGIPRSLPPIYRPPPIVLSSPPPVIVLHSLGPVTPGYHPGFPSPFPAGPSPMFPATGGVPPFASPGFGGFPATGFNAHSFGGFGGFGHGGGFGGHR